MKTDEELRMDIIEELRWVPELSLGEINVATHQGTVTLSGTVKHYADKFAAERAAQRVEGVKAIAENLQVDLSHIHHRSDTDIAEAVARSLTNHVRVPNHVQAIVEDGRITLIGEVHWEYQRKSAEEAVRYLAGVKGISNAITIAPVQTAKEIGELIASSLKRNAEIDAAHIKVIAQEGHVILTGTVRSFAERQEAGAAAWNAPGVTSVKNQLAVNCNGFPESV